MPNYKQIVYFKEEFGKGDYPQQLCNYIYKTYLKKYKKGGKNLRLLDLGSGKGNHLVAFKRLGISPFGIDKRKEFLRIPHGIKVKLCDLEKEKIPFKTGYFDFMFSKSVIEHVENIEHMMKECRRVLRPGGVIVVITPDWRSHMKYYYDDFTHRSPLTRKGLQNVLRLFGFKVVFCDIFYQLPFTWKYPKLKFIPKLLSLLPDSLKWKDKEEHDPRVLIRFSKEKMLLAVGVKSE